MATPLTLNTNYTLSIIKGGGMLRDERCDGEAGVPTYYFTDAVSFGCNYDNLGTCDQGSVLPGATGIVGNFRTVNKVFVRDSMSEVSYNETYEAFVIAETGSYEIQYDISHFITENGEGTTISTCMLQDNGSGGTTYVNIPGSENLKYMRDRETYVTSSRTFYITISVANTRIRTLHSYLNTYNAEDVPPPEVYVYPRGTSVRIRKMKN